MMTSVVMTSVVMMMMMMMIFKPPSIAQVFLYVLTHTIIVVSKELTADALHEYILLID